MNILLAISNNFGLTSFKNYTVLKLFVFKLKTIGSTIGGDLFEFLICLNNVGMASVIHFCMYNCVLNKIYSLVNAP